MNHNLPEEFKTRMQEMLQEEADAFFAALLDREYTGIRINTLKKGSVTAIKTLCGCLEPVLWCKNGYYADKEVISGKHPYHIAGLFYFQEPSAMSVVEALGIEKGDFVLDLCAAPGGKATHAAEKLSGTGLLVANEIIEKRAKVLAENISRFGVRNAVVTNESPSNLAKRYPDFFDKIIVDAPCSGEGMFRKDAGALSEWSVEHTHSCAIRQKKILSDAVKMLKAGGKLIYSTCTFAPCENEGVADWILWEYPDISLENITLPGLSDANAGWVQSKYNLSGAKRIFPHCSKGEGHFLALFKKNGGESAAAQRTESDGTEKVYREFEKENLNLHLDGTFISFGERSFLMPDGINIDKIKVESAGLFLGSAKKGRFVPSHELCLALEKDDFKSTFELSETDAGKYFRGETLPCGTAGWTAVTYNGFPVGWGKASDGILKNHFPKHLRF